MHLVLGDWMSMDFAFVFVIYTFLDLLSLWYYNFITGLFLSGQISYHIFPIKLFSSSSNSEKFLVSVFSKWTIIAHIVVT